MCPRKIKEFSIFKKQIVFSRINSLSYVIRPYFIFLHLRFLSTYFIREKKTGEDLTTLKYR